MESTINIGKSPRKNHKNSSNQAIENKPRDLDIMKDASEVVHYDIPGVPIYIRKGNLISFPGMRALSHWHEDIEWMHILDNEMYYFINNKHILLKKGDTLMVNTKEFHYGYSKKGMDCNYICVLMKPEFLFSSQDYINKYVNYVYSNAPEYLLFHDSEYSQFLIDLYSVKSASVSGAHINFNNDLDNNIGKDFDILRLLMNLWQATFNYVRKNSNEFSSAPSEDMDLKLQKEMVSFIHDNYNEAISLNDIAKASNISRSTCCRLFKKYVGISPIDYLNIYRLEVASYLLKATDYPVTQIATSCGINHLSYFSKQFKDRYGLSPLDYRNDN